MTRHLVSEHLFGYHCDGLIEAVKKAMQPAKYPPDHPMHDYEPYYGDIVGRAVWMATFVMREARALGLIEEPDTLPLRVKKSA